MITDPTTVPAAGATEDATTSPPAPAPTPITGAGAGSEIGEEDLRSADQLAEVYNRLTAQLGRVIVGQDEVIEQMLIAVLARGHCLLEGVPGLAKTLMVRSLAEAIDLSFRRIQFTPDLMPADITGTDIIQEDPTTGHRRLVFEKGPIFSQMILADEINRTPPKTQAALLEAMQERSVTIGGRTYELQEPFFVLATQNPIEQEGTYPLPEAQRDRFIFQVQVDYPTREQERLIGERTTGAFHQGIEAVVSGEELVRSQEIVRKVPVPEHVMDFVLDLVRGARPDTEEAQPSVKELIDWGPGPRAVQCLILAGKVRAILRRRYHVTVDDIEALALPVLRHRIVPTFNAEAQGVSVDEVIRHVLDAVPRGAEKRVI